MGNEELFEIFGEQERARQEEARERWGDTDAYKESARRAMQYSKADWEQIKAESEAIMDAFVRVRRDGHTPGDPETQAVVERHRLQIDRRFYPLSREMHAELGRMYVADPRFRATYESVAEGLAQFVCDATAWAAEHGGG